VRAALARVARDRAALAATILLLLPWWALIFLRPDTDWLWSFGEIACVIFLFWWMSRSGAAPLPAIRQPRLEAIFALALIILWMAWRAGICGKWFPFLPTDLNCFKSWEFEIAPKVVEQVIFPTVILYAAGYGLRAQGLALNLRAGWIALPIVLGMATYGLYQHQDNPAQFAQNTGEFFLAAGLPEEVLFRAILLTRLEAWWRSSAWALFGSAVIFGLTHLAINYMVFTSRNWRETWIMLLTFQTGFGVAFAFAYQRTRSIWPIALLHALVDAV
jgi:membrane protease YdiL (CAAX protease family)